MGSSPVNARRVKNEKRAGGGWQRWIELGRFGLGLPCELQIGSSPLWNTSLYIVHLVFTQFELCRPTAIGGKLRGPWNYYTIRSDAMRVIACSLSPTSWLSKTLSDFCSGSINISSECEEIYLFTQIERLRLVLAYFLFEMFIRPFHFNNFNNSAL